MDHQAFAQLLGNYGEFIGAIGVVVTLAYLATQVRYARIATTDQSRQARVTGIREINDRLFSDPDLMRSVVSLVPGYSKAFDSLAAKLGEPRDDVMRVWCWNVDFVRTHWAQYRSLKTPADTAELENQIRTWYDSPLMRAALKDPVLSAVFDPEFIAWILDTLPLGDDAVVNK